MATDVDTLSTYEAIAAAGIDDRGARAISKAIADHIAANRADLVTKADLENLRISLTATIDTKIAEVGVKIAVVGTAVETAQTATVKWVIITGLAVIAAIISGTVAVSNVL